MKRLLSVIAVIAAALGLAGCGESNTWNQKLTVTVATPAGEVSGSSVTRINITFAGESLCCAPGYAFSAGQSGEAVVVEVRPDKFLFALIEERQRLLAFRAFLGDQAEAQPSKERADGIETSRKSIALSPEHYPTLVVFADIANPKTVGIVDPKWIADAFGAGYRLKSITLEITDETVTKGNVERVLAWLSEESKLGDFWHAFVAVGYQPSGSTEARTFLSRGNEMPVSPTLMQALLAMDSYNRGYLPGVDLAAAGISGTQIGKATIRTDALPTGSQDAGFFAQAYTLGGQTVISYRGADDIAPFITPESGNDPWNGYGTALGRYWGPSATLAKVTRGNGRMAA
jgi:hypothetical protein